MLAEIHAIAGANIDAQLGYTVADRFAITKVPDRYPLQANLNLRSCPCVAQTAEPVSQSQEPCPFQAGNGEPLSSRQCSL